MAALADEYILTHRKTKEKTFTGNRVKFKAESSPEGRPKEENRRTFQSSNRTVVCFKCGKAGHIAIRCQLGKGPERNRTQPRKPQGAVTTTRGNQSYRPWTKKGLIRGPHGGPVEVSILRDTGASQSLLLRNKLPKGVIEATRETVMIEGIGGKRVKIPLCKITLKSQWENGPIKVGVVEKLPMKGISLILGNEVETKKCHRVRWRRWAPKMKKPRWRRWTPKMEKASWRKWAPKMKKKRWREWTPNMETRWRQSHVRDINDTVARRVRKWKEKKWTFHTSINKKIKGPVVRERMKVQWIIGIIIIIISCWQHGYPWPSLATPPYRSSP